MSGPSARPVDELRSSRLGETRREVGDVKRLIFPVSLVSQDSKLTKESVSSVRG